MNQHKKHTHNIHLLHPTDDTTTTDTPADTNETSNNAATANTRRGLLSCTAVCKNCLYHDYLDQIQDHAASSPTKENRGGGCPDMAIAFNAGIWGYDLWKPTLAALCRFHRPAPYTQ